MKLSHSILLLLNLLILSCKPSVPEKGNTEQDRPNIVFLFADDLTFETIRALGFQEVYTPNLDRLVNGGTSFTHAYNMGG